MHGYIQTCSSENSTSSPEFHYCFQVKTKYRLTKIYPCSIFGWSSNKELKTEKIIIKMAQPASEEKAKMILTTVKTLLAQKGYAGTTITLVAEQAGISRGLLHYYFKNKEDMLAQVIQENMETSAELVTVIFSMCDSAKSLAKEFTSALKGILETDPDFFNLFFEGWSVAHQSEAVNIRLKACYGMFREAIRNGLEAAATRGIISPRMSPIGLATVLTGLVDGIGLQMVTEPGLIENDEIWEATKQSIELLLT